MLYAANAKARSSACFAIRKLGLVDILTTLSTRAAVLELDFLQDLLPWHTPRKTVPGIRNLNLCPTHNHQTGAQLINGWCIINLAEKKISPKRPKGWSFCCPKSWMTYDDFMDAASHAPLVAPPAWSLQWPWRCGSQLPKLLLDRDVRIKEIGMDMNGSKWNTNKIKQRQGTLGQDKNR